MTHQSTRTKTMWIIGAIVIVLYTIVPIVWILSLSFKTPTDITNKKFWPTHWTWSNYSTVFKTSLFTSALRNSIGIVALATLVSVVFATFAAYGIARLDFPGNLWRNIHLFDTWLGVMIPLISFSLPLAIYVLAAFFREIPWEMEQAAQVDGATSWQAFRKVIVPLATPGIFTAAILVFFAGWNDFVFGISLTSTDRSRTVPAALAFFTGASQFQSPITAIAAAAVVVTVPIIIMVLIFQRRIVAGLTNGAVKG
jgi:multiple sugar transport system permease protein